MQKNSCCFQFRSMRFYGRAVFLAGFFLTTALLLFCPCQSCGGQGQPNIFIAMRNIGSRTMVSSSVALQKDTLTWGVIPPDGCKTQGPYGKDLPRKAVVSVKIENEAAFEQVVSLRGWDAVPEATDVTINFDVRTDIKKVIVTLRYMKQKRLLDYRTASE